ncbi:Polyamine transporter TPO5 [Trametes pubescens]|uniref:Polyamine transporter TPO5 n=1 Tax=Trametes pubescens TaxID=154538 RepID=A0A1M2VNF3_TRAPU|nr:Polyamine transporter TPO5 [Trametes pubescens]
MDVEGEPKGKNSLVFADVREVDDLKKLGYEQELARILSAYWIAIGLAGVSQHTFRALHLPTRSPVMLVCLSVEAKAGRHSAEFAFTHFDTSFSGWTPGWAFFIGLFPAIFGVGIFCAISINCAASRATWSFARDKAIPFYSTFAKVDSRFSELPLNAFLLCIGVEALLGLIFLGSSAAFNAFVGVEVMCLGASYAIPVIVLLAGGRKGVAGAPYPLGSWGWLINVMAILWVALEMVLFSMPAALPVDKSTMSK